MITGNQIQNVWQKPIKAIKKLSWHEPFKDGVSKCIEVIITGFRVERNNLYIYHDYFQPNTGKIVHDVDIANQFKIKNT